MVETAYWLDMKRPEHYSGICFLRYVHSLAKQVRQIL